MARFLLVAGAFHGAWCWELVIPQLEARGHHARAVELPGMGEDSTPFAELTFADWAKAVADAAGADGEKPILVGHSRGGVVISQAAELAADRIAMSVYLAALLVGNGRSGLDLQQRADIDIRELVRPTTADGLGVEATPELLAAAYEDSNADIVGHAAARVCPEPLFGLTTPLSLTAERYGRVPRAYIECLHDKVVPIEQQRAMQRLEPCAIVRGIDTDHCPNYSAPELLADTLDEIARIPD
jgi:pimeloyl-ACP methyl ester carboxylesterase